MLHMVNKIVKLIILVQVLSINLFAGNQTVDISLVPSSSNISQQVIGDKLVIDLGYLEEGRSYVGQNKIEIGTVTVRISQMRDSGDDPSGCFLDGIEFDSVNLKNLAKYSQTINTIDKKYVGNAPGIILTGGNVSRITPVGNLSANEDMYFFVSEECLNDKDFNGIALTSLEYDFKLYAEIESPVSKGNIAGAFAQDSNGVTISIKDLIKEQIKSSIGVPYKRRK